MADVQVDNIEALPQSQDRNSQAFVPTTTGDRADVNMQMECTKHPCASKLIAGTHILGKWQLSGLHNG